MRRREVIPILGGAALAWPMASPAQQSAMPVIGFVRSASFDGTAELVAAFRQGLRDAGYVEGQNVVIVFRSAEGRNDRLPTLVADLIRLPVNVIVGNDASALAAKQATTTVPIVFSTGGDPVSLGLVPSLNRPGSNLTGVTFLNSALAAKQVELLGELLPTAPSAALLLDTFNPSAMAVETDALTAARAMGIRLIVAPANSERAIDTAFGTVVQRQVGAVLILGGAFFLSRTHQIVALAAQHMLPAIYSSRAYVAAGGLMSYSGNQADGYRQMGFYSGRILDGARPTDLPVVRGTRVELAINLTTARALGLTIPPTLLARADDVIE
jgi:putative ABC transport system substrate-binding protein